MPFHISASVTACTGAALRRSAFAGPVQYGVGILEVRACAAAAVNRWRGASAAVHAAAL